MSGRSWPVVLVVPHQHQLDFALRMADGYLLAPPRCLTCNRTVSQILELPGPASFATASAREVTRYTAFRWGRDKHGVFAAWSLS